MSEVAEVLKNEVIQRHSYFQLKYFVIGKEPTTQSKMWQCLRELKTRRESLESIDLEVEETKDKIELLDIAVKKLENEQERVRQSPVDICDTTTELYHKECAVKIRQIGRQKKAAESNLLQLSERQKWLEQEARFFLESFKNLAKTEALKPFDDLEAQKQYWTEKLSQKLNLKMLTHNQLDTELIETIVALPDEMPIKQQTLGTLSLRHANMVNQLKETMNQIEGKK